MGDRWRRKPAPRRGRSKHAMRSPWTPWLLFLTALNVSGAPLEFDFAAGGNAQGHPGYDASAALVSNPEAPRASPCGSPKATCRVTCAWAVPALGRRAARGAARLMIEDLRTAKRQIQERSFIVNVRTAALPAPPENAPGGDAVRLKPRELGSWTWDDRLTVELPARRHGRRRCGSSPPKCRRCTWRATRP